MQRDGEIQIVLNAECDEIGEILRNNDCVECNELDEILMRMDCAECTFVAVYYFPFLSLLL
jgi:hypothetical protein